jgi:hypothetical protein
MLHQYSCYCNELVIYLCFSVDMDAFMNRVGRRYWQRAPVDSLSKLWLNQDMMFIVFEYLISDGLAYRTFYMLIPYRLRYRMDARVKKEMARQVAAMVTTGAGDGADPMMIVDVDEVAKKRRAKKEMARQVAAIVTTGAGEGADPMMIVDVDEVVKKSK